MELSYDVAGPVVLDRLALSELTARRERIERLERETASMQAVRAV
jgi:uncharacterized protein (UPF0335 family)